jgi:hypothetical protein
MRNRSAANAAYPIPYLKPYRRFCGSVASAILFVRLEHWFSRHPDGFWKYLAPPTRKDPAYKVGDSWIEEIEYSVDEFRTAFDHIGIRYKSKHLFAGAENPFKGEDDWEALYCSYVDRGDYRTYYRRNHDLVDRLLDEVNTGIVSKWKLPTSRKWRLSINRNGDSQDHDVNGDSQDHDKGNTDKDHEKTPHATVGVLWLSVTTVCKLSPDPQDLTKAKYSQVEEVCTWLRQKYPKASQQDLAELVGVFDRWRRNPPSWESKAQPYWGGGTLEPRWIKDLWQRFRLSVKQTK